MIKINEIYYDLNLIDIINELKIQLSSQGIYLFSRIKELPEDIMVSCPFHKEGQEKKPSCGIRKEDGFLHCFSCGESCSLEKMISRCFGKNDFGQYGLSWLKNNFLADISNKRNIDLDLTRNGTWSTGEIRCISESELDKYRYWHPYMKKRKLTDEVIELFDIGYDYDTDCITFPIKDWKGNCLFIARRSVKSKYFNYPSKVEKPVYGVYELKKYAPKDLDAIVVCESMINCLTVWSYGKYSVALNGTGTSKQIEQLKELPYRKIILALDPDEAGERGELKIFNALKNNKVITKYIIPKGKDVNDLSRDEFYNLQEVFF